MHLELVAGLAQRDHRRDDRVAEVLRVLLGRAAAVVLERAVAACRSRCLNSSISFVSRSSSFLPSTDLPPAAFTAATLCADLLLVLERRRQDVAVRHQHHQLAFDVDGLVVGLDHDLVARVQLALVEDLVLLEQLDRRPCVTSCGSASTVFFRFSRPRLPASFSHSSE